MADNYWEKRSLELTKEELLSTQEYEKQFKQRLSFVEKEMLEKIADFVEKYAQRNELSIESAEKQLANSHEWKETLEQWEKMANDSHYPELFKEYMDIEFAKSRISRMRALVIQTKLMMADFAEQETPKFQDSLESSYENNYYKSTYDIQDGLGTYQANFQQVSKADLKAVANQNWQGSNFSKRLWGNMVEEIPGTLEKVLAKGVTLGYDANRMTREAKQVLKNAKDYNVHRLILTEKRHIAETATMDSYHEQDVEKYRYLATLESRTCSICGGLDHKIFKTSEIERGVNYPLIHPHCRCTTTPYFDGMDEFTSGKRWSKNPVTGEKELVDRMEYSEWRNWVDIASRGEEAKAAYSRWKQIANDKTADRGQRDTAQKLLSGEWTSKINNEKQAPHMESTHQKDKSYFNDGVDVQKIFDKYAGTGRRETTRNDDLKNTETINGLSLPGLNYVNGEPVNVITGIKIHYSKARLHIVPYNGE
ncbi:minor capsid protein [Leuconostocaceae bacterium ESL0958]|nr:minor capsid protein [Leuconostocaceae bacterium ESL0958]